MNPFVEKITAELDGYADRHRVNITLTAGEWRAVVKALSVALAEHDPPMMKTLADAYDAVQQERTERETVEKLKAWLQWCLDNCDDSAEWNFGTEATEHMRALLAGKDAPMPTA